MRTIVQTDPVPPAERFPLWQDLISRSVVPLDLTTPDTARFHGSLHLLDLGTAQVGQVICSPFGWRRTERLIRRSEPEKLYIAVPHGGHYVVRQSGEEASAGPLGVLIHPLWRPFTASYRPDETGLVRGVFALVTRPLMARPPRGARHDRPVALPPADGVATLLHDLVSGILRDTGPPGAAKAAHVGMAVTDLVAAAVTDGGAAEEAARRATGRHVARRAAAYRFIADNLRDPGLTPTTVADALHISTRTLHRLFADERGPTVAGWILRQRLERCHRDLGDPALLDVPIHAVAAGWGITDPARFSRAYRGAYGRAPTEHRRETAERLRAAGKGAGGHGAPGPADAAEP
ncbi:hypothetical protein Sru01_30450 [Sphaerisporangium rufum]|uniref:HTH araC/xylS-type domain-containing protein n=1 Tax=Sphaerisporangium rufum TaxID=1381558 RepID=A0A919R2D4_9ACTN|nr:helix-turn-helix domain-containing protein [Sphaerisporangium rufum]GII78063.1 hypothetical protein Sru01_30450 [Sphaerisporangium rufum]